MSRLKNFWRAMKSPGMMLVTLIMTAGFPCLMALLLVVIHFVVAALGLGGALEK